MTNRSNTGKMVQFPTMMRIREGTMQKTHSAILALTLLLLAVPASTQEAAAPFVITEVRYEIDGRTRQWALEDVVDLRDGMEFADRDELEAYLADQTQLLVNQRQLQEASITYEERPLPEDRATRPIVITIATEDTLNIIALPYFKYDSNSGLLLSIRARDYNFFGTLQELSLDFDYEFTEDDENVYTVTAEFSVPFNMMERRWRLTFKQEFAYEAAEIEIEDNSIDFQISAGLGYDFDWLQQTWTASYTQGYRLMTADPDDDAYLESRVALETEIDTGVDVPAFGALTYSPEIFTQIKYWPDGISDERAGLEPGFTQNLGAGRADWIGNYRNGQTVRLGNTNIYNFDDVDADYSLEFELAWYRKLWQPSPEVWPKAGVSSRIYSFYFIDGVDEDQDDAAQAARGILNDRMNGDLGIFFNADALITVWTLRPIAEGQFGGFFDVAYVRDTTGAFYDDTAFDAERDLKFGGGIEVIAFPLFARSLYIRGSYGVDLREVAQGTSPLSGRIREIFIGLGHHY